MKIGSMALVITILMLSCEKECECGYVINRIGDDGIHIMTMYDNNIKAARPYLSYEEAKRHMDKYWPNREFLQKHPSIGCYEESIYYKDEYCEVVKEIKKHIHE